MRLGLRRLARAPPPTLFLAAEKRVRQAGWLASLWLGSDTAVVPTMDHLMIALRELTSGPGARELASGA